MGERREVGPTELRWNLPTPNWRTRFRPREPQVGLVRDVSVTGAAIVAPADETIVRGSVVPVSFGWVEGTVKVKRVDPDTDPDKCVYGVEFDRTDSALAKAIHTVLLGPGS